MSWRRTSLVALSRSVLTLGVLSLGGGACDRVGQTDKAAADGTDGADGSDGADGADGTDGGGDSGGPDDPVTWTIADIVSGEIPGFTGISGAFTSPLTDYTYALSQDGLTIRYITNTYIHPTGDWCVDPTAADPDCAESGPDWLSGRIELTSPVSAWCHDPEGGRIFLIRPTKSVEIVDADPAGPTPTTYNRVSLPLRIPATLAEGAEWGGGCAWLPSVGGLLISDVSGKVAVISDTDGSVKAEGTAAVAPKQPVVLASGAVVVEDWVTGGLQVLSPVDLSVEATLSFGGALTDLAIDPVRARAYGVVDGALLSLPLESGASPSLITVAGGTVSRVAVEPRAGRAFVLTATTSGNQVMHLFEDGLQLATTELSAPVIGMAVPCDTGDLVLFQKPAGGESAFRVLAAVPDHAPDGVDPIRAFIAVNIEEPSDENIDKPCTGLDVDSVEREIALIRANTAVLKGLGVPVSLGLTYNFALVTERCGMTDIFQELADAGFLLGSMVHNRPCYNCTNADVSGSFPDECSGASEYYCDPTRAGASCCFPDDPEYCDLADYDCYLAYLDEKNVVVDRNIPGGGQFIISADRHGLWEWDWIRAYSDIARADGGHGYDTTYFAQCWAYTEVGYDDSRGKNTAPWYPKDGVEAWAPEHFADWDRDSAFSDVVYLPGVSTSTLKLYEWQSSGLFLVDYFNVDGTVGYSEEDFAVAEQLLRGSLNHRTGYGPQSWYFHIHDIGLVNNLANADGTETAAAPMLRDFITRLNDTYVAPGHMVWQLPHEIRAEWSE